MSITKLKISNFKSFKNLEIDLNNFNLLIGTNASGKSNFTQIFRFLRDMAYYDLETAISKQGGVEYLRNINLGSSENVSLAFTSNEKFRFPIENKRKKKTQYIGARIYETDYELSIQFTNEKPGYKISEEYLIFKCEFYRLFKDTDDEDKLNEGRKLGNGTIKLSNIYGKIKIDLEGSEIPIKGYEIIPKSILNLIESVTEKKGNIPLVNTPLAGLPVPWKSIFTDIAIYDFDPKSSKKTTKFTGKVDLDENGENVAIILQHIKDNEEEERKFFNLLQDLLPFIEDIEVKSFVDRSLIFLLKEKYFKEEYLPASYISDGTINIIDLILALYFENEHFIIIEEPERNVHPHLLSKITQMMKEASKNKQVIVTTHNPEILKYTDNNHIHFISRDKKGFSTISKPNEREELKLLLEEIGIEELYIDNLLGE